MLLPPPAGVPAAAASLPTLELRAYRLTNDDGEVAGRAFPVPGDARRLGVVSNQDGSRVRTDLLNNVLIRPESRRQHRQALVDLVVRDQLDGIVLDYVGVAGDLHAVYESWLARLARDLEQVEGELVVTVPLPRRTEAGWDTSPYDWHALAQAADGLRISLPADRPIETEVLDSLLRWGLESVERRKLQLAVPVHGRDIVDGEAATIGFGEALSHVLDLALSDAPGRVDPGQRVAVELPTVAAADLGRDPATGMWRFHYWDPNRRQHTVWINDASGLEPAFDLAARYRLGTLALDSVAAGLDPAVWQLVETFQAEGRAAAPEVHYRLLWQLVDADGRVLQQANQPLEEAAFAFRAPDERGTYQLRADLVTAAGVVAAVGRPSDVLVAPPPPPPPTATPRIILIPPTPESVVTAAPPADEVNVRRQPVRIATGAAPLSSSATDATASPGATFDFAHGPLREAPSFDAPVVSDLRIGDRLDVLGRTTDEAWLRVRVRKTGVEGWVQTSLVKLDDEIAGVPQLVTATAPTP
jgi:hypothetical protein